MLCIRGCVTKIAEALRATRESDAPSRVMLRLTKSESHFLHVILHRPLELAKDNWLREVSHR